MCPNNLYPVFENWPQITLRLKKKVDRAKTAEDIFGGKLVIKAWFGDSKRWSPMIWVRSKGLIKGSGKSDSKMKCTSLCYTNTKDFRYIVGTDGTRFGVAKLHLAF